MTAPSDKFTRQQRRASERLAAAVERIVDGDRKFFERHPGRSHRLRLAGGAEIAVLKAQFGAAAEDPPAGFRWFAAVRQVAPGFRVRAFFHAFEGAETDADESTCAEAFRRATPPSMRDIEQNIASSLGGAR